MPRLVNHMSFMLRRLLGYKRETSDVPVGR